MSVYRFLLALLLIANGRDKDHEDLSTDNEMDSEELELWVRQARKYLPVGRPPKPLLDGYLDGRVICSDR